VALTAKQEAFCQKVACEGLNQTDAYKAVYDTSKSQPGSIYSNASSLARSAEVMARISALRGATTATAVKKAGYTLADAMADADDAMKLAIDKGQVASVVTAAALKAKLAGHMIDRKEVKNIGPLEEADVQELSTMLDELRARAAIEAGMSGQAAPAAGNRPEARTLQ
jgi:hypothetical protein